MGTVAETWAFTPPQPGAAACKAAWDGTQSLAVTVAATGAPVATFAGQSLSGLAAPLAQFAAGDPAGGAAVYPTLTGQPQQAAPTKFQPANPASTVSTSLVMMGMGATCTYTPTGSGLVQVNLVTYVNIATTVNQITTGARFGTGTAPANGAAVTGTRFGSNADPVGSPSAITKYQAMVFLDVLTLTPGTPYWFDVALATNNGADAVSCISTSITFAELPL